MRILIANIDKSLQNTEAANGSVLQKNARKNVANFARKNLRWSLFVIKLLKGDSITGVFR